MPEIDAQYRAGAAAGQLRVQRCPECGFLRFPPSSLCPRCLAPSDEWVPLSGRGVVWSWIRMHRQYFKDERRKPPYTVAMIALDEGPRMISGVLGDGDLKVGQPVVAVFEDLGTGLLPWFRPVSDAES